MTNSFICYCFGYSEDDIIRDVRENNGTSSILERILNEKKKGTCRCDATHPLRRHPSPETVMSRRCPPCRGRCKEKFKERLERLSGLGR